MRLTLLLLLLLVLSGCGGYIGSQSWYMERTQEIEQAFSKNEITKADYIHLKNEADQIMHTPRPPRRVDVY